MDTYVSAESRSTGYHVRMALSTYVVSRPKVSASLAILGAAALLAQGLALPFVATGAALAVGHAYMTNDVRLRRRLDPEGVRDMFGKVPPPDDNDITIGVDGDDRPLVFDSDRMRQHFLVMGPSSTGRSDLIASLVEQIVSRNSGTVVCISRDNDHFVRRLLATTRDLNREDDVLILDTGFKKDGEVDTSNTFNPFANGLAKEMAFILDGLAIFPEENSANVKERAKLLTYAVLRFLSWRRDNTREATIDVATIKRQLYFENVVEAADPAEFPDMPPEVRDPLRKYLTSLPGYTIERGRKQPQMTLDAHANVAGRFIDSLGRLDEAYGDILNVARPDIDMFEVARNRRILIVKVDNSPRQRRDALELARLVHASFSTLLGSMLGNRLEGMWGEVAGGRCMASRTPFMCVMDDVGAYSTSGMALLAAQARGLGFSMVYGTEDIPAMKMGNDREAASIIGNTNTKIAFPKEGLLDERGIPRTKGKIFEVIFGSSLLHLSTPKAPPIDRTPHILNRFVALAERK